MLAGFETHTEAFANGGALILDDGSRYHGNWYEATAIGADGNNFRLVWTSVDWNEEEESDRCDWDSPDFILDIP